MEKRVYVWPALTQIFPLSSISSKKQSPKRIVDHRMEERAFIMPR